MFAVIYHLYIDIHYTTKEGENIISSCNFLFLKAACEDEDKSWTAEILPMHSQEADLFIKVIKMHANIKLLDLLRAPSYIT